MIEIMVMKLRSSLLTREGDLSLYPQPVQNILRPASMGDGSFNDDAVYEAAVWLVSRKLRLDGSPE